MRFKLARRAAGLSVDQVSEKLHVSRGAVYQWECGFSNPRGARLIEVARLYGCTADELLAGNPQKEKKDKLDKDAGNR